MPVDAGGGTGARAKPARPKAQPAAPRVWWLNGKAYYSEEAYFAAVAAQQRIAQQQSAARKAAADAARHARLQAVQQRELQTAAARRRAEMLLAAQKEKSEAAARGALEAAAQERQRQEAERRARLEQVELQRQAALRRAEMQRLVEEGRVSEARRLAARQASEQREIQRRAGEARVALARRQAYEALQRESRRSQMQIRAHLDRDAEEVARIQEERAREMAELEGQWRRRGGLQEGVDGNYVYRDEEREDAIRRGQQTGDWSSAIDILDAQSRDSGGRYVDERMLQAVNEQYVQPVTQVGEEYTNQLKEAERLLDAEDMDGLRTLIESDEFKALEAQFTDYFGDGRKPGSFARPAQILTDIAVRRERLWMGLMLDPSGQTTDEAGIQRLLERAEEGSRVQFRRGGLQEGADFAGERDLTFSEQVLDPETGKMKTVQRVGLDAYLAREAARAQAAQEEAFRSQTERLNSIRRNAMHLMKGTEGPDGGRRQVAVSVGDGRIRAVDLTRQRAATEAISMIPDGQARFDAILNAGSMAEREVLVRNFLRDASAAWDEAHQADRERMNANDRAGAEARAADAAASTPGARSPLPAVGGQSYTRMRWEWLSELKNALLGDGAGDYGWGEDFGQSYGAGDLFRSMQLALSIPLASAREARAGLGELGLPTLDLGRPNLADQLRGNDGDGFGFGPFWVGTDRGDLEGKRRQLEEYQRAMQNPDPNVRAEAQRSFGMGVIGGNVGWILEGLADPLNYIAPGSWVSRARLAAAVAGGGRQVLSGGGLARALATYTRYSAPQALGGFGRSRLRTDLVKLALAREVGVPTSEIMRLSDDQIRELAEKAARGRAELAASDAFQRMLTRSGIDKEQLLNRIQEKLPGLLDEFDLSAVNPFEMQARIRAAREGFVKAERQAEEALQLARRREAQAAAREALEQVRREAGMNVGERISVSAASIAKHEKLLTKYVGATREYLAVARRAARAADELEALGRLSTPDRQRTLTTHRQLEEAVAAMRKFEDQFDYGETGQIMLRSEGLVSKRYKELAAYRATIGGDPSAPSYVGLAWKQVRADRKMVVSRIRGLQKSLASATDEAEIARLRLLLARAHEARIGVEFEAALLDHGRAVARGYGKRNLRRVRPAVRPQRLGQKALDEAERAVEASRSVSNRIASVEKVTKAPRLSEAAKAKFDEVRTRLGEVDPDEILRRAKEIRRRRPGAAFADVPVTEVMGQLERLLRKMNLSGVDVTLEELLVALWRVSRNDEQWGGVMALVKAIARRELRQLGGKGQLDRLMELLSTEHIRRGAVGSIDQLDQMDKLVADALAAQRQFRARGLVRGGGTKRYTDSAALRTLARPDRDPIDVLVKIRALREHGMDVFEYDSLRGALRPVMMQRRTQGWILEEARAVAAREGIDLDSAYLKVRDRWAEREALREFEEFAARVENQGRAPEQILRLFEERYIGRDLGWQAGTEVTQYEMASLRAAWREVAGFDYDMEHLRRSWLSGQPAEFPAGARRARPGEFMDLLEGADPDVVRVIPKDSDYLDIPFARARDLDPEDVSRLEQTVRSGDVTTRKIAELGPRGGLGRFEGPRGATPKRYRAWLWEQINEDSLFRRELKELYYADRGARWRNLKGTPKHDLLAKAARWIATDPQAKTMFRRHALSMEPANQWGVTRRLRMRDLKRQEAALETALREARNVAGGEFLVPTPKWWLQDIRDAMDGQLRAAGAVDAAKLTRAMKQLDELLKSGSAKVAEAAPIGQLSRLRGAVDDLGIASIDDLLSGVQHGKRTEKFKGFWRYPDELGTSIEVRRVAGYESRLRSVRAELKELAEDAAVDPRRRGRVGVSVAGDGVYIVEGTSNVTVAHELFHQFWDDSLNTPWRRQIQDQLDLLGSDLQEQLWRRLSREPGDLDIAELAAELYALWRVGDDAGSDVLYSWRSLLSAVSPPERVALDALANRFEHWSPKLGEGLRGPKAPPLHDRMKMRTWLVENGYWSPRTGEAIASGERVWSIAEERAFFEANWGYTPPWTDPDVMKPLLHDQRLLQGALEDWGFFEDGFESVVGSLDLTVEQAREAVIWGLKDADGKQLISAKRSLPEMRRWVVERFGPLAGSMDPETGAVHLRAFPWLMTEREYDVWIRKAVSASGAEERSAQWLAARAKLPKRLQDALFEGDALSRFGLEIDPTLVKAKELDKLGEAIAKAVRRRMKRLREAGDADPGVFLPQEQLRFAFEVADELLADPVWRGMLRGMPVVGAGLSVWSQFWRMLVSFQPAFPIMNLIETFGTRRLLLAVYENGGLPLSLDGDGRRLVQSLRHVGAESASLFNLGDVNPWVRVGDRMLPAGARLRGLASAVKEVPLRLSAFGEDRLRLDFARSVAGRTFRSARRSGMDTAAAEALARFEAKRLIDAFFITGKRSGVLLALDQIFPFFTYNWNNKRLAVKMIANHPSIPLWGERIARAVREANREAWIEEHGSDVGFEEGNPSSSWLWLKIGDDFYNLDLSIFSDWTRAMKDVLQSQNAADWFTEFIRIPHPSQLGALAMLTGGLTPWGKPGHIRELSFWADLVFWMQGVDYEQAKWKRDWIQISSQMLFFKAFGKITPLKAKLQVFHAMEALDRGAAEKYLEENPDLAAYLASFEGSGTHWYGRLSDEERAEYDAAYEDWQRLNEDLDARIFPHANEPWSEGYKQARREAHIARTQFLKDHPILPDSWGTFMSPKEFAELGERWLVDDLQDAWFNWPKPQRGDFENELAYQRALVAYHEKREDFLAAHPALAERLFEGRNAIENAWHEQELHWSEVLEFQAKLKLRILEEQERPEADQELIDLLYDVREAASRSLDAEAFVQVPGVLAPGQQGTAIERVIRAIGSSPRLIRRVAEIPGFSDFLYERADKQTRRKMDRDDAYMRSLKSVMDRMDALPESERGAAWYDLLREHGIFDEYMRRNPDKHQAYLANQEYISWMQRWVARLDRSDFNGAQAVWDAMPAWVKQRYLERHPESGMRDGMGGSSAVNVGGQWFKGTDSARRFLEGQEYYAAMQRWVGMLKQKDYVEAERYFSGLPDWIKERYYAKHPDQRAKNELELEVLRRGAEYFLARGDDKLKILQRYPELRRFLRQYGGDEEARRGLVMAMYRALPDSWVRRVFRERFPEYFSQEAAGERRIQSVLRELAEHPEMLPFYEKALGLQLRAYTEQLRRSGAVPKPWTMERKSRHRKRRKRRAARMHSLWALHSELRHPKG